MKKFDTYDFESDGCHLQTFGILFEADSPEEAIRRYKAGETIFWNNWRGSFYGILRDNENGITLLFNDHIGSKMVFYSQTNDGLVWATDPYSLARAIGANVDNENFLWQLLLSGYSPDGETPYKNIHRLMAGEYICARKVNIEKHIYHRFDNTPNNLSLEENIERIDKAFRRAVERVIRKNEEYGYTHYIALSAGLDSRMVNRVAHEIAKTPIHHITYSQSGYYDETIPRELAAYWKQPIHFTALDGGDCLMALDEVSQITKGMVQYSGAAETLFGLPKEAKRSGGIFLTGMVGDIIIGTAFTQCNPNQKYYIGEGALLPNYRSLLRRVMPAGFEHLYPNREIYYLYVRGFNCADLGSPLIQQVFGESYSPFCDVDVLETAYAVPVAQRWQHKIYDQWILRKYPDMAQWKHNGIYTIGQRPKLMSIFGRAIPLTDIPKRVVWYVLKKLHIHDFNTETEGNSMNPEDDWFAQNETLRNWAEEYIQTYLLLLDSFPEVQQMAKRLSRGNAVEKMQVLSLLACLRQTR